MWSGLVGFGAGFGKSSRLIKILMSKETMTEKKSDFLIVTSGGSADFKVCSTLLDKVVSIKHVISGLSYIRIGNKCTPTA